MEFHFYSIAWQLIYHINKVITYYIPNKCIIVLLNICNNSVFLKIWNFYEGQILRFDSILCIISHKINVHFLCFVIGICSYIDDIFYLEYFATLLVILTFLSFYMHTIFLIGHLLNACVVKLKLVFKIGSSIGLYFSFSDSSIACFII